MRALGEPDAFPTGDIGLLRAMATESGRPTPAQLQAHAARWRPWRSYAALHLWASDPIAKRATEETSNETVVRSYVIADRNNAARV
jgi:AraC family transcriptional regulator, regulatory protein of adaptative response / DNA-3-methyladenine glycosylase II